MHQDPRLFDRPASRWTREHLAAVRPELAGITLSSVGRLLHRLGIRWKRGRVAVTSPDPDYPAKLAHLAQVVAWGQTPAGPVVTLSLDELTFYRQPTVAHAWAAQGRTAYRAAFSHAANTLTRVLGALDVRDGRVTVWQGRQVTVARLVAFYQVLRAAYPEAERLFVLQDNWPVHFHPDVLVALEPQKSPWPRRIPAHWSREPSPTAQERWGALQLPIQIVPLPTYAPWTNPIEKLWRWLRQDVLHLHQQAADLPTLRAQVAAFLAQFATGSAALLRYVGLGDGLPPWLQSARSDPG